MSDALAPRLLAWHARHGRRDLPWQHPRSAYRVWLSEVMLQQTQVATVVGYFQRFVAALPDIPSLAAAEEDQVMALWSGLGYYRRARFLHQAARICMARHDGALPRDFDALLALPGIGRSTAGAILAQAFGERHAILDGNVKRVLTRYHALHGWPGDAAVNRRLWQLAEQHTPDHDVANYTQAIMDLGATLCTRRNPRCADCPVHGTCLGHQQQLVGILPTARERRSVPQRETCMLILHDTKGRVLLQQRDGHGVWPRLWSLPEAADAAQASALARRLVRAPGRAHALPDVQHAFSHFRLCIHPLFWQQVASRPGVGDNDGLRWCTPAQLDSVGLPAPVRRLLESLQTATDELSVGAAGR